MSYQEILEQINQQYKAVLKDNLVGIYVHGSIAFGCYNPVKSDIDFLVVVDHTPSLEEKKKMIQILLPLNEQAGEKGLEMSVVCEAICREFVYPTPFELHFSKMHVNACRENLEMYCKTMNGTDEDLAAHFTVVRSAGYALCGKTVSDVFGEVDKSYYLESLKADLLYARESAEENPVYALLNYCRVLAYIGEGSILSKAQGAVWGMQHVPEEYISIIQEALNVYQSVDGSKNMGMTEEAGEFLDYLHRCIFHTEY